MGCRVWGGERWWLTVSQVWDHVPKDQTRQILVSTVSSWISLCTGLLVDLHGHSVSTTGEACVGTAGFIVKLRHMHVRSELAQWLRAPNVVTHTGGVRVPLAPHLEFFCFCRSVCFSYAGLFSLHVGDKCVISCFSRLKTHRKDPRRSGKEEAHRRLVQCSDTH